MIISANLLDSVEKVGAETKAGTSGTLPATSEDGRPVNSSPPAASGGAKFASRGPSALLCEGSEKAAGSKDNDSIRHLQQHF